MLKQSCNVTSILEAGSLKTRYIMGISAAYRKVYNILKLNKGTNYGSLHFSLRAF